ncbi:Protein of unknown function (DUF1628) [Methanoregula formicica SMSP]|uniref:Archaeal Type IV pilin N-terminal domain-containing protein n=2 Tax=Methanoregula formicica TaxID=882104 RepID=L0HD52_METFS|nr:Protein of unknown function (DUF1628) [Methanoregula formicica SMSP]
MYSYEKSRDAGVSPVVGVMLMLVVTIIIAAVVSAFAGGLTSGTQKTPSSAIDVKISTTAYSGNILMIFNHISGDNIPTKDLSIITYYKNSSGYILKHTSTAKSSGVIMNKGSAFEATKILPVRYNMVKNNDYGGRSTGPNENFGNFTWQPGDSLNSVNSEGTSALLGMRDAGWGAGLDPSFTSGSTVDVKILYNPSNTYIFDKEVVVL